MATLAIAAWLPIGGGSRLAAQDAVSWPVLRPADRGLPMSENLLVNSGFEEGEADTARGWEPWIDGYAIDAAGGRSGGRALVMRSQDPAGRRGAYQVVALNQSVAKPLYFSGWSRALEVTGEVNADYSVYLDLRYQDGTPLYGQTLRFDVGSHDWQFKDGFIVPAKPVALVIYHVLFRNNHAGTVWFDDLELREVAAELVTFDSAPMAVEEHPTPPYGGSAIRLSTEDGLGLELAEGGGAVTGVTLDGHAVGEPARAALGGFLLRDVAANSLVTHVGGRLVPHGQGTYRQADELEELGLRFEAIYRAKADRIQVDAQVAASPPISRALSLYFALPLAAGGWQWWDDARTARPVEGTAELCNLGYNVRVGATGRLSRYPWASLAGPDGGLAIALPLDQPRLARLVYNPQTAQFYVVFDFGLSPLSGDPPAQASVSFILYRIEPEWGFRSAAQGYYDRFPEFFKRRLPPDQEGIWVAFSDLSPIPNIEDFGIRIHELGSLRQVAFDDAKGIYSFRYIAEPWSHWMAIDDLGVDPANYEQVMAHLRAERERGNRRAEATLSSGFWDEHGRYRVFSTVAPWCAGRAGCAVFVVNPDPDIADPEYQLNKANLEWNDAARAVYESTPGLDGEYIDSYLNHGFTLDFRPSHFAASDLPLVYRTGDWRLGVPQVFATTEFARWLTDEVHQQLGRFTMANGILWDVPWGADLFDFMGTEINWLREGKLVVESDRQLLYRRTLAYQRPYGFLMNTSFDDFGFEMVERYFQVCLFYGIYPSLFSHNAAEARYWDNPNWYERDRPLFVRYIPLIRRLNQAGWQPVTFARSASTDVIVERFGQWPEVYFTLRNLNESATVTTTLAIDVLRLGIPGAPVVERMLAADRIGWQASPVEVPGHRTIQVVLGPGETEVLRLRGVSLYLPVAVRDAANRRP